MAWNAAAKKSENCMDALKSLSKDEILEVLRDGFCADCQARLDTRIQNLVNTRGMGEISIRNGGDGGAVNSSPQSKPKTDATTPKTVERKMSEEQQELIRLSQVGRKKDFVHYEKVNGKSTNILQGLELHTRVFNEEEQKEIVDCVHDLYRMGEKGQLKERTFSAPKKWMRGKGRVTLQFGCCYNYAVDKSGNPPGIVKDEEVDPLPSLFKKMIKRMVRWHVLPATCIPNSCIVNIYEEGDCIPPHIDHHDFLRPFCTVSFLSECNILFGSSLKVVDAGEFKGPVSISLPIGSVLILNGNGADVAKHCVPGVPTKRISITFRRMDDSKIPHGFLPDPELLGIKPIAKSPAKSPNQQYTTPPRQSVISPQYQKTQHQDVKPLHSEDDFPPLGAAPASQRSNGNARQKR